VQYSRGRSLGRGSTCLLWPKPWSAPFVSLDPCRHRQEGLLHSWDPHLVLTVGVLHVSLPDPHPRSLSHLPRQLFSSWPVHGVLLFFETWTFCFWPLPPPLLPLLQLLWPPFHAQPPSLPPRPNCLQPEYGISRSVYWNESACERHTLSESSSSSNFRRTGATGWALTDSSSDDVSSDSSSAWIHCQYLHWIKYSCCAI